MTGGMPLHAAQQLARHAADTGHAGLVITEAGRTAYLSCAAAALAADVDLLTGIAVAFPRSPMVTAQIAWELADATDGRFRLGLGTQVRAHIERRYNAPFDPPGPRIRDYIGAVRACFDAFRGASPLDYHSDHYELTLLPPVWSPGPIGPPDPPIDLAAVSPWMLRLAGQVADGVHVHPLNTRTYLADTVLPQLAAGAQRAGRHLEDFEIIVPAFLVVGDTPDERDRWRELARTQIAFYGSTPNYSFIFDDLGHPGTTDALRERQKAGDIAAMSAVITDDILRHFVTEGTWATIADAIGDRYAGIATRVVNYFGAIAWTEDPQHLARWKPIAEALSHIP
ncbi:TIGR03617 family F420-dependent LLM class oxidoreductase [Actinomarinicola tropica]|uniref:TIGR03617 family F420-dependent LLM class oxidoreductase n=2 Tax=Actinomarinicola tropica TaxID=2789776 RepID=A0A5Q2RQU2_9ACTN|nr:TIGR03617 family F420-dependent LLM class oxidoreductase [Actinomarinicola tropica]